MKYSHLLIVVFFLTSFHLSYAQNLFVLDSLNKKPVSGATVVVLNQKAGEIKKQGSTDEYGRFEIGRADTGVHISITAIGYKKVIVKGQRTDLTILLIPENKILREVVVSAAKSPLKFNGNIIEYNIGDVPNAEYLNLVDIIDRLPFLQVEDRSVKMMNEPLTILIDGKQNAIYSTLDGLKSLPPQAIEKVEVALTPTARTGGKTLNITLKRDYFLGWNGALDMTGTRFGVQPRGSVSYWRKKMGFDASVSDNYGRSYSSSITNIDYIQQNSTLISNEKYKSNGNNSAFYFSSYYNITTRDALDFQFSIADTRNNNVKNSDIIKQKESVFENQISTYTSSTSGLRNGFNLGYTHQYRKQGNAFYLLTNYSESNSSRDYLLLNTDAIGDVTKIGRLNELSNTESTIEAILQQNSNKKFRYIIGSKLINRNYESANTLSYNELITNTPFNMQQLVSTSYLDIDKSFKKFVIHSGLRFEYNTNRYKLPDSRKQRSSRLVPNLSLTYNKNRANLFMLTYSRRVSRPGLYALEPVFTPTNAYEQNGGQTSLNNETHNNWGLQYYGNYKIARIGFNFNYLRVTGLIRDISTVGNDNIIHTVSTNVKQNETLTAGISGNVTLLKKIRVTHFNSVSYIMQSSDLYSTRLWSGYLSERINYQMNKKSSLGLSFTAFSPNIDLQGVSQDLAYLNWGANYSYAFDLVKKYPSFFSFSLSNLGHYNGLPSYSTVNSSQLSLRRDSKRANSIAGISLRIQLKGKQFGNRTFKKEKSIENNDLTTKKE